MAKFRLLSLVLLLTGCALGPKAIPETIAIEGGTSARHEVGESPVKQNTALLRVLWRLRP